MAALFFRTILIYFLLTLALRIMGKRQVGELEISELVTTLLLSEIAALPIDDPDIPLLHAVVPILLIFSIEIIITHLKSRWNPLKRIFESKPTFLIERGVLRQDELLKNRITVSEFISACRIQGVSDIFNIYYAILEQDGKLSVMQRAKAGEEECGIAHPLILDGEIEEETVTKLGLSREQLDGICLAEGADAKDLFLLQIDDAGAVKSIKKNIKTRNRK